MKSPILKTLLSENPLVITGLGCVSAAGGSSGDLWMAALNGRGLAGWQMFENHGRARRFAVCAANFDRSASELQSIRRKDRAVQLAWLAAGQAVREAGLSGAFDPERTGIIVGTSRGPLGKCIEAFSPPGPRGYAPSLVAEGTFASISGALAQMFGVKGPGATVSATCASSAFAISLAAEQILLGKADVMIVGGTESPLQAALLEQLDAAGVLGSHEEATRTSRPFDVTRNGLVLGEGGAFLVIESERSAAQRGAAARARLAGWATNLDNSGRTGVHEDGAGLQRVMRQALDLAGMPPDQIDYINAHGSGTRCNDEAEARAVSEVIGERCVDLPCTSTKPVTGHCLGATPALEAVIAIEALRQQKIPPTANCDRPDPLCPINPLSSGPRDASVKTVMSNSLGFWGYQAALIFSRV